MSPRIVLLLAFDSVPRKLIYRILDMLGVPSGVSDMIKELYNDQRIVCKAGNTLSGREKATTRGVKQGCPLSPLLFNLCLEFLIKQMDLGEGTTLFGGERAARRALRFQGIAAEKRRAYRFRELLFADDIALVAETLEKLKSALQNLTDTFSRYGLKVSIDKTKWQALDHRGVKSTDKILINGEQIKRVDEFVYLGSVFNERGTIMSDVKRRIRLANDAMRRVRKIIHNKATPMGLKRKILMTFIYPTLTYGCETWPMYKTGKEIAELKKWWHQRLRNFLGVTTWDHYTMEEIFKRTGAQPIEKLIDERRLRYLGHMMRYPQQRPTKRVIGASARSDPQDRKNHGWTRAMSAQIRQYGIKVKHFKDKDKYRRVLSRIFRDRRKTLRPDQFSDDSENESQPEGDTVSSEDSSDSESESQGRVNN